MIDQYFYENNRETIDKIKEIDKQIHEQRDKGNVNPSEITRLMYEQMLRGLYLNNPT